MQIFGSMDPPPGPIILRYPKPGMETTGRSSSAPPQGFQESLHEASKQQLLCSWHQPYPPIRECDLKGVVGQEEGLQHSYVLTPAWPQHSSWDGQAHGEHTWCSHATCHNPPHFNQNEERSQHWWNVGRTHTFPDEETEDTACSSALYCHQEISSWDSLPRGYTKHLLHISPSQEPTISGLRGYDCSPERAANGWLQQPEPWTGLGSP